MRSWIWLTAPALLVACSGGGELAQPNPPPVWPMEGVSPDDLPTGEDVRSPTAPPAPLVDTDLPVAPADTDAPTPEEPAETP